MTRLATIPRELAERAALVSGAVLLVLLGRDRFYYRSQQNGALGRLARSFSRNHYIRHVCRGWDEIDADHDRVGRSTASFRIYSDATLGGYGTETIQTGDAHLPLEDQQRSLLLPEVREAMQAGQTALEIGAGNGDVLALLARERPDVQFIGTDLDLSTARAKHPETANLRWAEGYALEQIQRGEVRGDVMFSSSTFCVFPPAEMKAYAQALAATGCRDVIVSDPLTRGYHPDRFPARSMHCVYTLWGHDYRHHFGEAGYATKGFRVARFAGNRKRTPFGVQIYWGQLTR